MVKVVSFTTADIACLTPVHLLILGPPIFCSHAVSLLAVVTKSSLNSSTKPYSVDVSILVPALLISKPQTCEKFTSFAAIVVTSSPPFLSKLLTPLPM